MTKEFIHALLVKMKVCSHGALLLFDGKNVLA
jgi:hypothetical protein